MGIQPILPVKMSMTIETMFFFNFDNNFDEHVTVVLRVNRPLSQSQSLNKLN